MLSEITSTLQSVEEQPESYTSKAWLGALNTLSIADWLCQLYLYIVLYNKLYIYKFGCMFLFLLFELCERSGFSFFISMAIVVAKPSQRYVLLWHQIVI